MSRPNLRQLFEELQPISTKWKRFGTFLDVPNDVLDPIDEDNKNVDEKLYSLCRQWLEIKPRGIWNDVVTALRKIKRLDLEHRLEEKFIKPPSRDTSNDRSDPMSTSLSLPYTPAVTSLPNPIVIDDKTCTHVDVPKKLLESVDDFVIRFIFLLTEIQSALKQKLLNNNLNLEKLGRFICNLLSICYEPLCVTEGRDEIDSLFRPIMGYLSFLRTHLFHSIDKIYLNCMFETEIEHYDDKIDKFMKSTVIIEFKEMIQSKRLEKGVPVILKLSRRWEKCMLDHLHHLVNYLFEDSSSFLKFSVIHHSVLTIVYIGPESLYLSLIVMATRKVRSMRLVGVLSVQVGIILMKVENVSNIEPSEALSIAAEVIHDTIGDDIKLLVNIGGDVNFKDKSGHTPLLIAAFKRNLFALNALLESKANPDIQDNKGVTALYVAAQHGHYQCVDLLLKSKANPDIQDCDGVTALASMHGHDKCISLLLQSTNEFSPLLGSHTPTASTQNEDSRISKVFQPPPSVIVAESPSTCTLVEPPITRSTQTSSSLQRISTDHVDEDVLEKQLLQTLSVYSSTDSLNRSQTDSEQQTTPVSSLPNATVDKAIQLDDTVKIHDVIIQPGHNDSKY